MSIASFTTPLASLLLVWNPFEKMELDMPESEWLELNGHIVYPVVGLITLGILAIGVVVALKSDEISGMVKVEYKRELVHGLRRNPGGYTLQEMVKLLKLKPKQIEKLLEEFEADGILQAQQDRQRGKIWRLRGVGPN